MKPQTRALGALLLCLSLIAAACGSSGSNSGGGGKSFTLKIGVVTSLTGDLAPFGAATAEAVRLAAHDIQQALSKDGIKGIKVQVSVEDVQGASNTGIEAAKKLVETDNVNVLVGALASAVT